MTHFKNTALALVVSACFSLTAVANDEDQQQTLDLEDADVAVLQLATIENEADKNANEVHQEITVGRAGLQGGCIIWPDL